jgi:hypothetical protein
MKSPHLGSVIALAGSALAQERTKPMTKPWLPVGGYALHLESS